MALAFKCDRCGTFSEGFPAKIIITDARFVFAASSKQVCAPCAESFADWLAKPK